MKKSFLHAGVSLALLLSLPIVCRSQGLTVIIAQETGAPPVGALSPRWIFTMKFANGAAGAYKTDHFQLFTSIPNSFDPVNDNCMFQYSRYGGGNGTLLNLRGHSIRSVRLRPVERLEFRNRGK